MVSPPIAGYRHCAESDLNRSRQSRDVLPREVDPNTRSVLLCPLHCVADSAMPHRAVTVLHSVAVVLFIYPFTRKSSRHITDFKKSASIPTIHGQKKT